MRRPRRLLPAVAALAALAGCAEGPLAGPGAGGAASGGAEAGGGLAGVLGFLGGGGRQSLPLYGGAVTVRGPEGYCADPAASAPGEGFAVLASCLRTGRGDLARLDALMTVQVGGPGSAMVSGAEDRLAALMEGPEGRALLASGAPVAVSGVERARGAVFVEYSERGAAAGPAPPPLWRAFLDLGDRLATVSIRPVEGAVLGTDAERRLIGEAVAALRAANPPA